MFSAYLLLSPLLVLASERALRSKIAEKAQAAFCHSSTFVIHDIHLLHLFGTSINSLLTTHDNVFPLCRAVEPKIDRVHVGIAFSTKFLLIFGEEVVPNGLHSLSKLLGCSRLYKVGIYIVISLSDKVFTEAIPILVGIMQVCKALQQKIGLATGFVRDGSKSFLCAAWGEVSKFVCISPVPSRKPLSHVMMSSGCGLLPSKMSWAILARVAQAVKR